MSAVGLLGGLVFGLLFLGLALLRGELLALALPLLVYLGAGLLGRPEPPRLRVVRTLSADRVRPGEPVTVTLTVENEGPALPELAIVDRVPEGLRVRAVVGGRGGPRALGPLPPGGRLKLEYQVRGGRGGYRFLGVELTAQEPLGLSGFTRVEEAPALLLVLPEATGLRRVEVRPRRTRPYAGPTPARQSGPGVEIHGVREYRPGDPLRWLSARAIARHPERLYIKEFEPERTADVGLILDARRRANVVGGGTGQSLLEHGVQAAAALAEALLAGGHRVGLLVYGGHLDWVFPGAGRLQREKILRALARVELGASPVFQGFEHLPTRLFPARSQIVLISPLLPGDEGPLIALRARGYALWVISPDPIAFELKRRDREAGTKTKTRAEAEAWELARRIARVERALLLRRLRQAGALVLEWDVEVPFPQFAEAAFRRSPWLLRALR